jgi:hypothetical protein
VAPTRLTQFVFVVEMARNNFMNQGARNLRKVLTNFIQKERLFVLMCWSILFFKFWVMRDGRVHYSSSWICVLPSLNIRHHFLAFVLFIKLYPNTSRSWRHISIGRIFCVFKNSTTPRTSQLVGFQIFLLTLIILQHRKTKESARHSLGFLLRDYWGPWKLKWYNSLTCASAMHKWSSLSGWPLYVVLIYAKVFVSFLTS